MNQIWRWCWVGLTVLAVSAASAAVFRHKDGWVVRFPDGWTTVQGPDGLAITPPAAGEESHLMVSEPSPGVERADDPRVADGLDQQVRGVVDFVRLQGKPETLRLAACEAAVYTWAGKRADGKDFVVRAYVAIFDGRAIAWIAFGAADAVAARDPAVRRIFATLPDGAEGPVAMPNPGPTLPGATGPAPAAAEADATATPLVPDRQYVAGNRLMTLAGVSFGIPEGCIGGLPAKSPVVLIATNPLKRLAFVATAAMAPDRPTLQSLLTEYISMLTDPVVLGKGVTMQVAGQPAVEEDRVVVPFAGQGPNGPLSALAVGRVSALGSAILAVSVGAQGNEAAIRQMACGLVAGAKFGPPREDPGVVYQKLGNHRLTVDTGSHVRTSPDVTSGVDSRSVIDLWADGRFLYQYRSMGMVTTPQGGGNVYDVQDRKEGRWRVEIGLSAVSLVLIPKDNSKWLFYDLRVDGTTLLLNGRPAQVQQGR